MISLLLFAAAILFWLKGNEHRTQQGSLPVTPAPTAGVTQAAAPAYPLLSTLRPRPAPLAPAAKAAPPETLDPQTDVTGVDPRFPLRLRNTSKKVGELVRVDTAILLRQAFIDTANPHGVTVPSHLRAGDNPGSYLVQAKGPIDEQFRQSLLDQGATIVSYIPNNAYLVRMEADQARAVSASALTRTVLPYEPYYKLDDALLGLAVEKKPLPEDTRLRVTAFPQDGEAVQQLIARTGSQILSEGSSPFGPQYVVQAAPDSLAALVAAPGVQLMEQWQPRALMLDLTRVLTGVQEPEASPTNYMALSGSNIWVAVADSGIDSTHPDFAKRVFYSATNLMTDTAAHGTHMAGIIASSGQASIDFPTNGVLTTNPPPGSLPAPTFEGLAPSAKLLALPVNMQTGPVVSDSLLAQTAARSNYLTLHRTNAMVSNNSWGYPGVYDYDSASATYDAAVRDALPELQGSQGMVFVFAAGNNGNGNTSGLGGDPDTILSPGTAKNVITVGASDSPRYITNEVAYLANGDLTTNAVFLGDTDSGDEIIASSSRGNVGIGLEGDYGRFKPDVVAPGAFVISTAPKDWLMPIAPTNGEVHFYPGLTVLAGDLNNYAITVPSDNTNFVVTRLLIETLTNKTSPNPLPTLNIYAHLNDFASPTNVGDFRGTNVAGVTNPAGGTWYYAIENPGARQVNFDLRTTVEIALNPQLAVNDPTNFYTFVVSNLNVNLRPYYRYESGTSVSAAHVSGMLALIQEFFEQKLKRPYSPALLKALVLNGARSINSIYSFQVQNLINYQGWGLINLASTLPSALTNTTDETKWPVRWLDQSPTNSLATGEQHTYRLTIPEDNQAADLKVTLVWTDPPGNPSASIKLVNDLDLVVSNEVNQEFFLGNDIPTGSDYNRVLGPADNLLFDNLNNVETVLIHAPLTNHYTIQVVGRRVNVNSVTAHTNAIVQDYALVVSTLGTNGITLEKLTTNLVTLITNVPMGMSNGLPLLNQRAGANSPLLGSDPLTFEDGVTRPGSSNQWHFYAFTNSQRYAVEGMTNGANVAFITFLPPNLAVARTNDADVDLYVTRGDSNLLTLETNALRNAFKSLTRGGTELIVFTNAVTNEVFYIGVKAEDQEGAEYGLVGLSSAEPFETLDQMGNRILRGMPARVAIPDGVPSKPGAGLVFAVGISSVDISRVVVSNQIIHGDIGDLLGNLSHYRTFSVLNNHTLNSTPVNGIHHFVYDDTSSLQYWPSQSTDGPGGLRKFIGMQSVGPWILSMVDNAPGHTGLVQNLFIRAEPQPPLDIGVAFTLQPGEFRDYFYDVPADASKLTAIVTELTGRLDLFLRRGTPATVDEYDKMARLDVPGGELSIGVEDSPPLIAGRYYIGLYNPSATSVDGFLRVKLERNLPESYKGEFTQTTNEVIGDDRLTLGTNVVPDGRYITDLQVGVRLDHPRASDLSIQLVSPQGTRLVVDENRGGTSWKQLGYDTVVTNYHHVALTYATNTGLATLYLDGTSIGESKLGIWPFPASSNWFLGYRPKFGTNLTDAQLLGTVDEADLYRRALTPPEILSIYKFGGAGKPTNELTARWQLDGSAADTLGATRLARFSGTWVAGKFGQAAKLANTGDFGLWTNASATNIVLDVSRLPGFTVDVWVNPADLSEDRPLIFWGATNRPAFELSMLKETTNTAARLQARFWNQSGAYTNLAPELTGGRKLITNGVQKVTVYANFLEDTNRALAPIKFANPYTGPAASFTNQLISGFESVSQAMYRMSTNLIEGWEVLTNDMVVLTAPKLAHTGTNLLALRYGTIGRTLPTEAGHAYQLRLAHRLHDRPTNMVAWWTGNDLADPYADELGTNDAFGVGVVPLTDAKVGRGLLFTNQVAGSLDCLRVADRSSLAATNEFSFELWFRLNQTSNGVPVGGVILSKGISGSTNAVNYGASVTPSGIQVYFNDPTGTNDNSGLLGTLLTGYEGVQISPTPAVGGLHHLAGVFKQQGPKVEISVYLDGQVRTNKLLNGQLPKAVNTQPLVLGANALTNAVAPFNGVLDEVSLYQRALQAGEIERIYELDVAGKCPPPALGETSVIIPDYGSSRFLGEPEWATNSLSFLAATNGTYVMLASQKAGVLVDSVELTELVPTDFLPEEPLNPFLGEVALGEWRLEVIDRRTGLPIAIDPTLLSWQLKMTFAPPVIPAVRLTNSVAYTNSIAPGTNLYFIVEVPKSATMATNSLTVLGDGKLSLLFNQNALPNGDPAHGDYTLLTNVLKGTNWASVIATNQTFYGNFENETNRLVAPLGTNAAPLLVPGQRYYLALTNATTNSQFVIRVDFDSEDTNIAGLIMLTNGIPYTNNILATNYIQYYGYNVPTNAEAVRFSLQPTNGDANLYVRRWTKVNDPLPTPRVYDYSSEAPGTNLDVVIVTDKSVVPLTPGLWLLGVHRIDPTNVYYTVMATNISAANDWINLQAGQLTPTETIGALPRYFTFTPAAGAQAVEFFVTDVTKGVTIYVGSDDKVGEGSYLRFDYGASDAPGRIVIRANEDIVPLASKWYVAVVPQDPGGSAFSIRASIPALDPADITLTSGIEVQTTIPADAFGFAHLDYFRLEVPASAQFADFTLAPVNGNVDLLLRKDTRPTLDTFDTVGVNPGNAAEFIRLRAGELPVGLTPGRWVIGVLNQEITSVTYKLKAQWFTPSVSTLVSGVPAGDQLSAGATKYYQFAVSADANRAIFQVKDSAAPLEMYLRGSLPLPDQWLYDYAASVPTGVATPLTVLPDSFPIPLTAGTWYLAVRNPSTATATYTVTATERRPGGNAAPIISPSVSFSDGKVGFSWTADPGLEYSVEYTTNLPPQWRELTNVVTSPTGEYQFSDDETQSGGTTFLKLYRLRLRFVP